jgi:hypothetical protein
MKSALLTRLKRLETVRAVEESDRPLKVEFAYLKQLPREYSGLRHIVSVSKRPDGRCNYEERPGEAPPNQERSESKSENVMTVFFVRAQETGNEIEDASPRTKTPSRIIVQVGSSAMPST